ncbi:dolichol phosphate-mannose biosynthesis regulatory, partial [Amylocystis lapponica]
SDRTLGGAMLFTATSIFVYYTCWAILLPFFDADSPIHGMFPSREWAVRIPAFVLVLGMSAIGIFIGSQIIKDNSRTVHRQ